MGLKCHATVQSTLTAQNKLLEKSLLHERLPLPRTSPYSEHTTDRRDFFKPALKRTSPFYRFKKACTKNIHSLFFFMEQVTSEHVTMRSGGGQSSADTFLVTAVAGWAAGMEVTLLTQST